MKSAVRFLGSMTNTAIPPQSRGETTPAVKNEYGIPSRNEGLAISA